MHSSSVLISKFCTKLRCRQPTLCVAVLPCNSHRSIAKLLLQKCSPHLIISSSSHDVLFLSVAVSTTDRHVSRLGAFFHADERPICSGLKSSQLLHVARYGWVFLSVASSPREAFGLVMRLNGDDLHLVNCYIII